MLARTVDLAQRLARLLRRQSAESLEDWLDAASTTPLARFASRLRRDLEAARGAITTRWSTSPVEGQIGRLEMLKAGDGWARRLRAAQAACARRRLSPSPATQIAEEPGYDRRSQFVQAPSSEKATLVVDAERGEPGVQRVPVARLVGMGRAAGLHPSDDDRQRLIF